MYDENDNIARDGALDNNRRSVLFKRKPGTANNVLGQAVSNNILGWVGRMITELGNTRRHVYSLNPGCALIVAQTYPLQIVPNTPGGLFNALKVATQGSAVKATARQIVATPVVDVTLNLGAIRSFGVHVRITDSLLNFKSGTYKVQLLDGATVLSEVTVLVTKGQVDFVMLGISNNGGMASLPGIANPQVKFVAADGDYVPSSTALFAETLNDRDIGVVENASGGMAS